MEDILEEARGLAESGVKELNLVAQDTTKYGQDLYGEYSLDKLLTELCKIDGFHWIRVLYGYPDRVTDGLLEVMAREPKVVKYIDLPLQHASGRVLKEMNRKGDFDSLCALMQRIRDKVPGVVLRTTLIAGFPARPRRTLSSCASLCAPCALSGWAALPIRRRRIPPPPRWRTRSKRTRSAAAPAV